MVRKTRIVHYDCPDGVNCDVAPWRYVIVWSLVYGRMDCLRLAYLVAGPFTVAIHVDNIVLLGGLTLRLVSLGGVVYVSA